MLEGRPPTHLFVNGGFVFPPLQHFIFLECVYFERCFRSGESNHTQHVMAQRPMGYKGL